VLSCATFYARRYVRTVSLFAGDVRYLGKNSVILDDILEKNNSVILDDLRDRWRDSVES